MKRRPRPGYPPALALRGLLALGLAVSLSGLGGLSGCAGRATLRAQASAVIPGEIARFRDARALGRAPDGRLFVADAGAGTVVVLSARGVRLESLGGPGTGPYAFLEPAGLDPTNGLDLFVADAGNGRVQRYSDEGRLVETIPVGRAEGGLGQGAGLGSGARPPAGGPEGDAPRARPVAVAAGPGGVLFVADAEGSLVVRLDRGRRVEATLGDASAGAGALARPVALAAAADGTLYVADAGRGVVQIFGPFGAPLRSIPGAPAGGVRGVALAGNLVLVVGPRAVALVRADGGLERVVPVSWASDAEPLVGAALAGETLLVLTATRLVSVPLGG